MARRGGWRRVGRRRPFRYVDSRGERIVDEQQLERIEQLVIPPAWSEVWISPRPRAKLQATGVDSAGRRQYLYHHAYRAAQEREKFDRLVRFAELLPDLRHRVEKHLDLGPYEREWTCAVAITLINLGWFRVGSDRYARTSRTYGITTLTKRHVRVRGSRVAFRFRAKNRARVRATLVDAELADAVRALLRYEGGARLLRFDREGEPANLTAAALNEYIVENMGDGFTAKDFRTWGGTLTAAVALAEQGPPESADDERHILAAAMRRVAAELGNTPTVARASYVSPAVIDAWREGRTLERFSRARRVSARDPGLRGDEAALLRLLRAEARRRGG